LKYNELFVCTLWSQFVHTFSKRAHIVTAGSRQHREPWPVHRGPCTLLEGNIGATTQNCAI
jgi:hypothetical protein